MSRIMKIRISFFVFIIYITHMCLPSYLYSAEVNTKTDKVVTDIQKGQRAPYNGVLLTQRLITDIKNNYGPEIAKTKCNIVTAEAVGLANSQCTKESVILQSKINSCESLCKTTLEIKNNEILKLKDLLAPPPWYKDNKLWFGLGVGLGIALSGSTIYFVSKM